MCVDPQTLYEQCLTDILAAQNMNFTKATPVTHPEETSLGRPERALMRSLCEAELDESRRPGAVIRTDCTSWGQYAEGKTLKSLILHLPLHIELSIQLHPVTLATSKNLRLRRTNVKPGIDSLSIQRTGCQSPLAISSPPGPQVSQKRKTEERPCLQQRSPPPGSNV